MTPVDRDILERLENGDENELVLTPALIAANTDWGHQTIREHVSKLREYGLVEYCEKERGIYRLSDLGREYLAGELDTEELEDN
ncbi:winged helix-turn-helix domain-containing protein [Halorubrum ezzemoulense]|uniref:winged helix-turn-helix domain-containing protein n=1 Tax=Halorubrum ezzemoulense TaxID=337243 RepID=UPI00232B03A7|nr:winged helix-turn-helix domain-containing protein [Halorubrum ezzemoulense]MDB2283052.1 winged helix-turn-helix domain-containing protein [Halorubrum ezzemoulense]